MEMELVQQRERAKKTEKRQMTSGRTQGEKKELCTEE
jgi:hypothetical protein